MSNTAKKLLTQDYQRASKIKPKGRAIVRRIKGRKSRMGFMEYVAHLFYHNEHRETWPTPLLDFQIKAMLMNEFSRYDSTVEALSYNKMKICSLRTMYNAGEILPSSFPHSDPGHPPRLSLRYSEGGLPVIGQGKGRKGGVLTNGELKDRLLKYHKVRETFEELMLRLNRSTVAGIYPLLATN